MPKNNSKTYNWTIPPELDVRIKELASQFSGHQKWWITTAAALLLLDLPPELQKKMIRGVGNREIEGKFEEFMLNAGRWSHFGIHVKLKADDIKKLEEISDGMNQSPGEWASEVLTDQIHAAKKIRIAAKPKKSDGNK